MVHTLGILALVAYLVSLVVFLIDVFTDRSRLSRHAERAFLFGFITHTALIVLNFFSGSSLLPTGKGDFYLFLSWGLPIAYAVVRRRMRFPIVGSFFAAATVMFLASSSYLLHLTEVHEGAIGYGFLGVHVFPALVAELCLVIAVALSIIFSIQEQRFKRKKAIAAALSAPSLDLLSLWTLRLVNWGFITMSFSVASGSIWALFHQRSVFTRDPFQWMGFLVWLLLVAIHLVRSLKGQSGRVLSQMTIVAGIILVSSICIFIFCGGGTSHAAIYLS